MSSEPPPAIGGGLFVLKLDKTVIKDRRNIDLSVQEILTCGSGLLLVLMTLIQVVPVKINPWSWLAKTVGRAINTDISKELGEIKAKLESHLIMDDRRTADGHRARVLHFNNELLRNINHTKEEFIEVLAEIDAYVEYCRSHPDYPNNRAVLAIENIREIYKERLKKHDFLQEGSTSRDGRDEL